MRTLIPYNHSDDQRRFGSSPGRNNKRATKRIKSALVNVALLELVDLV